MLMIWTLVSSYSGAGLQLKKNTGREKDKRTIFVIVCTVRNIILFYKCNNLKKNKEPFVQWEGTMDVRGSSWNHSKPLFYKQSNCTGPKKFLRFVSPWEFLTALTAPLSVHRPWHSHSSSCLPHFLSVLHLILSSLSSSRGPHVNNSVSHMLHYRTGSLSLLLQREQTNAVAHSQARCWSQQFRCNQMLRDASPHASLMQLKCRWNELNWIMRILKHDTSYVWWRVQQLGAPFRPSEERWCSRVIKTIYHTQICMFLCEDVTVVVLAKQFYMNIPQAFWYSEPAVNIYRLQTLFF